MSSSNKTIILPTEIALKVCTYIRNPIDLCHLAQTCRHWAMVTKDERIWRYWCEKRFGRRNITQGIFNKLSLRWPHALSSWKDWFAFRSQFRQQCAGTLEIEVIGYESKSKKQPGGKGIYGVFVCHSQPPQNDTCSDKHPAKFHFDEYNTIIDAEFYRTKPFMMKDKYLGKVSIPLFLIRQSNQSTWLTLDDSTDSDSIEDGTTSNSESVSSTGSHHLHNDMPSSPDHSERRKSSKKNRKSSRGEKDATISSAVAHHSASASPPSSPTSHDHGILSNKQPSKPVKRILLHFKLTPVLYTVDDFEMLATISRGTYYSPNELLLVRDKETCKNYFMKIISTRPRFQYNDAENEGDEDAYDEGMLTHKHLVSYSVAPRWNFPSHPFLVDLFTSFQTDCKLYLLMEWVSGGELFFVLRRTKEGRFDEGIAKFYTAEVALGLEHLHQNKIVYRDLKPENILLDAEGHAKITQRTPPHSAWDSGDRDVGTLSSGSLPEYLAPELLRGCTVTPKVDWWSLGTILYHMLVGQPPFVHHNVQLMYHRIMYGELELPDFLSDAAKDLLRNLLSRDVKKRFGIKRIKSHPWFADIDWHKLEQKQIKPPIRPLRRTDLDFSVRKTSSGRIVPVTPTDTALPSHIM